MKVLRSTKKNHNSLTERVYEDLRMSIITGKIKEGTRLVESSLAAALTVSRTPIREALHKLALEGLLYSIPRAGYIVEEMSDYDIQDLFAIRMTIEQIAVKMAIEKISLRELKQLEINLSRTDGVLQTDPAEKMAELDTQFHGIIYKATRSKTLYQICQSLGDHTLKYRIALIHIPEIVKKTRDGHYKIFKAIQARDPKKADQAIQSHLELAKKDIIKLMEQKRQEAFLL